MRLTAGDLTLRPPEAVDVPWIHAACQDAEIARWTRVPQPYHASDAVAFVAGAGDAIARGTDFPLLIELTDTGELLGAVGAHHVSSESAEVGYWIAAEARGRHVARRALNAVVEWADERGIELLFASVLLGNEGSERVLAACGFTCVSRDDACAQRGDDRPASRWERRRAR